MNSFNHYAYGAIGDWMYRVMAGLDTRAEGPGYKQSIIKPHIGGGLTHVSASLETYYGTLSSSWKTEDEKLTLDVEIPANTTATVYIPADNPESILEGGRPLAEVAEILIAGSEDGWVVVKLGSGRYRFER
jgi:alpha-L-rhamnosidase